MKLKEKLLCTKVFIDNDYLTKYVGLVELNRETKKERFKTQRHHIIPKCYYKINNLGIDNSNTNLVNLLYKDHVLAHYYLSKCMTDTYKYHMFASLLYILGKYKKELAEIDFNMQKLDEYQKDYEEYKKYNSEHQKGCKGRPYTEEMRINFSKKRKGHPVSEETRKKLSVAHKGNTYALGHKISDETRKKLSEMRKGKHFSPNTEWKKGTAPWCKGKHFSDESRHKMSLAKKGKPSPKKGTKMSEESRRKMSESHKGKKSNNRREVVQFSISGEFIKKWESLTQAGKELNILPGNIHKCCNHTAKTVGGYVWRYKDDISVDKSTVNSYKKDDTSDGDYF